MSNCGAQADNGTFLKSRHQQHVICIQTGKRTSFEQLIHHDYFLSFEQLIHLDYFTWQRVGWWRDGFLVTCWLVARRPDTVTRDRDNKAHTHTIYIYLPFTRKSKGRKLKDVENERCENCSSRKLIYKFCTGTH